MDSSTTAGQRRVWHRRIAVWLALMISVAPFPFFLLGGFEGGLDTSQWLALAVYVINFILCLALIYRRARGDVLIFTAGALQSLGIFITTTFGGSRSPFETFFNFAIAMLIFYGLARWLKTT